MSWRGRGARLLLVGVSICVGLGLGEVAVRVFIREPILPRFVRDSGYGIRDNMPGIATRHIVPGDFSVAVTTNRRGMRSARREYREERTANTYRVALLGDSFVFGYGVEDDEVISSRLEDSLNEGGALHYEVLNFGAPGFGQTEELITYWNKVRPFAPDAVVLFYFSNDLGNNQVSGLFEVDSLDQVRPSGRAYLPGVRVRERLYAFPVTRWLFEHSQLWNVIRNRLSLIVQRSLLESQGMGSFNSETAPAVGLTRAMLRRCIVEIQEDGALPIVFIIPTREMQTNMPLSDAELGHLGALEIDGRDFLRSEDYFGRDTHWRASGHDKSARILAGVLTDRRSPP